MNEKQKQDLFWNNPREYFKGSFCEDMFRGRKLVGSRMYTYRRYVGVGICWKPIWIYEDKTFIWDAKNAWRIFENPHCGNSNDIQVVHDLENIQDEHSLECICCHKRELFENRTSNRGWGVSVSSP